jgi:hypothetical protein
MEKQTLEQWKNLGWTLREMAATAGKSQTTIRYWLDKFDLIACKKYLCLTCGEVDFSKFRKDGTRYTECRKCHSLKQVERFRLKKKWAVALKGGKCERCGYNKCCAALDFHHRNPSDKDLHWENFRGWSRAKIESEIAKCELICANCHREEHFDLGL